MLSTQSHVKVFHFLKSCCFVMTESICASATWYICSSKRFPLKCNVMERADARLRHPSQETLLSVKILRGARVNDPLKMFSAWTGHAVDFCFFFVFFLLVAPSPSLQSTIFCVCVFLRQFSAAIFLHEEESLPFHLSCNHNSLTHWHVH